MKYIIRFGNLRVRTWEKSFLESQKIIIGFKEQFMAYESQALAILVGRVSYKTNLILGKFRALINAFETSVVEV